ncbi:SDR family NAD(P)-dependent oxidoreductase [Halosegnis sp.]|uniref:SDR family NAD(P)-dependent oxidoreductase n=1 Tax=Halosegnis sp. TaxID=2864959 RepID=UPI0035D4D414
MSRTVVIAGVGPGLGASLARRFDSEGCAVGLFARSHAFIEDLAEELSEAVAATVDVSDPADIEAGFQTVREALGPVDVLVFNASSAPWKGALDVDPDEFDRALDTNVRGALYCVQEAVPDMREAGEGTVIFTGATTSVRGREGAIGFSAAKFGARGMAESMARELGSEGIHVAHVVVDGGILPPNREITDPEAYLDPDAVADSYWHLVEQDRSAWTLELDLRPYVEEF